MIINEIPPHIEERLGTRGQKLELLDDWVLMLVQRDGLAQRYAAGCVGGRTRLIGPVIAIDSFNRRLRASCGNTYSTGRRVDRFDAATALLAEVELFRKGFR